MTIPYMPHDPSAEGFTRPRLPGTSAFAHGLERRLPRFIVHHSLLLAWIWIGVWAAVALTEEFTDIPAWVFTLATVAMVLPSLTATALCLWVTPRYQLFQTESILTHFVSRFITVVFAFVAWTFSIVIGASISSLLQLISENKETEVIGTGFQLIGAITPVVAILIWLGLVMRCSWFLIRLRGWRARPTDSDLPSTFLSETPLIRQWTITLAHPGLLATAGILSAIGTTLLAIDSTLIDFTI